MKSLELIGAMMNEVEVMAEFLWYISKMLHRIQSKSIETLRTYAWHRSKHQNVHGISSLEVLECKKGRRIDSYCRDRIHFKDSSS